MVFSPLSGEREKDIARSTTIAFLISSKEILPQKCQIKNGV
jgi:hypothetical protein